MAKMDVVALEPRRPITFDRIAVGREGFIDQFRGMGHSFGAWCIQCILRLCQPYLITSHTQLSSLPATARVWAE